jgi:phosphoenolpyruvate synthase/pyruvate phosphate dikinase
MSNEHPITPPPELVQEWWEQAHQHTDQDDRQSYYDFIATRAARWGADMELEACRDQLRRWGIQGGADLLAARRPKPQSLKKRIAAAITDGDERTALLLLNEALPND